MVAGRSPEGTPAILACDNVAAVLLLHRPSGMDELDEIASRQIQSGWDVFSAEDEQLGTVDDVSDTHFTVATNTGGHIDVDFEDVESSGDGRVTLNLSPDELADA